MDEVLYGKPAAESVAELVQALRRRARVPDGERHAQPRDRRDREGAPRARQPLRRHLRQDAAAHAARGGDRRRRAGARGQGRSDRHPGRRLDHRRRQGRPALPRQRHQHASRRSTGSAPARTGRRRSSRPRCGRSRSRPRCRPASSPASPASPTSATKVKELFRHPAHHPAGRDARSRGDAPHADVAVPLDRHPRRRSLRRGRLLQRIEPPIADASALHGLSLLARGLPRVKADPADMRGAARLPDRLVAVDGRRWPPACRWAPATASATCWARCSTSRTATPRASCCPR